MVFQWYPLPSGSPGERRVRGTSPQKSNAPGPPIQCCGRPPSAMPSALDWGCGGLRRLMEMSPGLPEESGGGSEKRKWFRAGSPEIAGASGAASPTLLSAQDAWAQMPSFLFGGWFAHGAIDSPHYRCQRKHGWLIAESRRCVQRRLSRTKRRFGSGVWGGLHTPPRPPRASNS